MINERKAVWEEIALTMNHKAINYIGPLFYAIHQLDQRNQDKDEASERLIKMSKSSLEGLKGIIDSMQSVAAAKGINREEMPLDMFVQSIEEHLDAFKGNGEAIDFSHKITTIHSYRFQVDLGKIKQILEELIANARYWVGHQGKNLEVTVRISVIHNQSTPRLQILFRDNGPGIAHENKEKIFWPYETKRPKEGGTGLGLHIVHDIAQLHGGTIVEQGEPGAGACFCLQLPINQVK